MSRLLYVTTPIYYVNAPPHLGTFYSTVVADALARHHRARHGKESTFFLTGTDEHGQRIEQLARAKGVDPGSYTTSVAETFKATWKRIGSTHDRFIRTTDPDHKKSVQEMWRRMAAAGDIYLGDYDGLYCAGCEDFKTADELIDGEGDARLCPVHRKPVDRVKEPNYFFRLSRYGDRLLDYYAKEPAFIRPETRRNEVLEFVRGGLRDLSVSRTSVRWGLPVPGDEKHTIYVWIDALTNYVTALGGPSAVQSGGPKEGLWRSCVHLIAKDILRFHAVYWPAMLMSAGLPLPRGVFCHGYLTVKGQKISKSIPATRVDPNAIADELGVDPLRYFVLREYSFGADGDFTYEALFQRHESDLGNDLGNLLNRTVSMAHRFVGGRVPREAGSSELGEVARRALAQAEEEWERLAPSRALESTWELVRAANTYIDRSAPWKLAKDPGGAEELGRVLANACEAIRWIALMVSPAMPRAADEILRQLGLDKGVAGTWPREFAFPGATLAAPDPVFPRLEPERQAALIAKWVPAEAEAPASSAAPASAAAGASPTLSAASAAPPEISREDFERLDLRTARVVACERVPKTDKLLQLTLDLGGEQRTVVSGIAAVYPPESLVGRTVVYVANLKPAKIRGVLSRGMILAAGEEQVLALCALDRDVPPGTRVR